jgi:hypothetical protein
MSISGFLKGILNLQKKVDLKLLPSQGLFYKDDFQLYIKKVDLTDIIEYEYKYVKEDLGLIISKVKKIVEKSIIIKNDYTFDDIKSVDIIFLFLEIVRFSKGKPIEIDYIDSGIDKKIEFNPIFFNYYKIDESTMNHYDEVNKEFFIDDYKYSLPTIGVENSLTNFLIHKSKSIDSASYNNYSYDFTFFVNGKNVLSFSEIENLIQIFNFDLEEDEKLKIKKIVNKFQPLQKYSLIKNGKFIDINSKIDLENIWK